MTEQISSNAQQAEVPPVQEMERRAPPPVKTPAATPFEKIHASPSVRLFARELGVDLNQLQGSGRKGRIVKQDVQDYVKAVLSGTNTTTSSALPTLPSIDFNQFGPTETKPLHRIQTLSGAHLRRAWLNLPMVTQHHQADITELEAFRKSLQSEQRITTLAFIMRAVVSALREYPKFNSSLSADGQQLIYKKYIHIGIAVDTPNGLVVPVIRDVAQKSIYTLSEELSEISAKARDGKLSIQDLQGGCFSISNLGGIGGGYFTPIVNAPEVAILGTSRARQQARWDGNKFNTRLMLPLSLSYDHRVIDGADGARFVVYLAQCLENARRLLL